MIDPRLLRGGLRIGLFVLLGALLMLPFQPRDSAALVVSAMAAVVGAAFVAGILLLSRWGGGPRRHDSRPRNGYNNRTRRRGP